MNESMSWWYFNAFNIFNVEIISSHMVIHKFYDTRWYCSKDDSNVNGNKAIGY